MMPAKLNKAFVVSYITFIFLLWVYIFRDFINGTILVNVDSAVIFTLFKYYYNNLFNGTIPLWEPYIYLGRPHTHLALSGALNVLAFPIYMLHFLGVDYYSLYMIYSLGYLALGICGFFLLSRIILKNDSYALLATSALMFSGLPAMLFNQVVILMLFVPALWFFIFFLSFFKEFKAGPFWGMVCSLMVMAISYLPFYFICLFMFFLIFYVILFTKDFVNKSTYFISFLRRNWILTSLGVIFIMTTFIPLFLYKILNATGEITSPGRHKCTMSDHCQNKAEMNFDQIAYDGTFGERFAGGTLFSHLDKFNYNDDSFLYVPSLILIFLSLASLTIMDRERLLIFCTGSAILIISLGAATPFYKLLFDHVFFLKYFRNLFFFAGFLIPLAILFATAQLKSLLEQLLAFPNKKISITLLLIGHAALICLMIYQGDVIPATYLTILLSLIFLILFTCGVFQRRQGLLLSLLTLILLLEPMNVFIHYRANITASTYRLPQKHDVPKFEYERPSPENSAKFQQSLYGMFLQLANFKDSSGVVSFQPDFLNSHVFNFYNTNAPDHQKKYTHRKIVLYDHFPLENDAQNDPIELTADSAEFKVLHFDVNSLTFKTNFSTPKFLVYRDAYSNFWKAFINGKQSKIELAESAFKGLSVPAGENVITFRYTPPGGEEAYILVLLAMFLAFCMLGLFYINRIT